LVREIAGERRNKEMASSLRKNEGESVSWIVIRLKILLGPRDPCGSAPVERKFFPNDRAKVVTVNLDQTIP